MSYGKNIERIKKIGFVAKVLSFFKIPYSKYAKILSNLLVDFVEWLKSMAIKKIEAEAQEKIKIETEVQAKIEEEVKKPLPEQNNDVLREQARKRHGR